MRRRCTVRAAESRLRSWACPCKPPGGHGAGSRQYARAVTPEQLQDVVADRRGGGRRPRRAARRRSRAAVVIERPRNPEHGDYATNVALRLAKPAGRPAARGGRAARRGAAGARRASPSVDVAGPGLPQHHVRRRARWAPSRSARSRAGAAYGRTDALAGQQLNLEFVSANPTGPVHIGAHPVGRGRRRAGPAAGGDRRRRQPRVLLQRRRLADRPLRPQPAGGGARAAGARGRLRTATTSPRSPPQVVAAEPGPARAARGRAAGASSGRAGVELMLAEIRSTLDGFGVALRRVLLRADAARVRRPGEGRGPAARAGPRLRGRRRGLAADHRLRRRQGPGAGQGRRRAHLLRRRLRLLPGQARAGASSGS